MCIPESSEQELRKIGIKDSKLLTAEKREKLSELIEKIAKDIVVLKIGPCKIDNYRRHRVSLNKLESIKFAEAINLLSPHEAYIDSPEINLEKITLHLRKLLDKETGIICEHKADSKYPVVAAASIIAKTVRDDDVRKLREMHGDFGSGYSSDEKTIEWLKNTLEINKKFPEKTVRETWDTVAVLRNELSQSRLSSWLVSPLKKLERPMENIPEED